MKLSIGEKWFVSINYVVLALIGLSCLLPFIHVLAVSLSGSHPVSSGHVSIWPKELTLDSYKTLIQGTQVMQAFKNSVIITVGGVLLSMIFTILAAYPLSRNYFYARRFLTLAIVFTMLFSGGMIPTFLVVKALGLLNSYWAIWLLGLISAYNMLVLKSFLEGIPSEMEDAARIDGCGEFALLTRIMLPLSLPVLAALTLFYGVYYWNLFLNVLIYIQSVNKHNLTVMVQQMINSQSLLQELNFQQADELANITPEGTKSAGVIVMVVPMLLVYPLLQKYFVKGVMIGAIKG